MKTTSFQKQNFGLYSTTYYSTVPITCTQTRIYRTQSLYYNKSLKPSSIQHIVTINFTATIYRLACKISLQLSLARTISLQDIAKIVLISHWFIVSVRCFADISEINRERSEQSAILVHYPLHYFCKVRTGKLPIMTSIFLSVLH